MPGASKVLVTDIAWPDLAVERSVLEPAGLEPVLASSTDERALAIEVADAVAVLTCFAQVTATVLAAGSHLRVVARTGVGLDNIDLDWCTAHRIAVTNVPNYCVGEVADHSVAMALSLWRRLPDYDRRARRGAWGTSPAQAPVHRLAGRRVAVLGRGRIGAAVAQRWQAFGVEVANSWEGADIVSLHLPLTDSTRGHGSAERLSLVNQGAILINTSRGPLVDLVALEAALETGQLSGAALDVFPDEPLPPGSPLAGRSDVLLTPHVAFYSEEALLELRTRAATSVVNAVTAS